MGEAEERRNAHGGHSYQGTSNAPDSLLVWTCRMTGIEMNDAFVAQGCAGRQAAQPAVTIKAAHCGRTPTTPSPLRAAATSRAGAA
ncbi:hypothetical protein [Mesorhizobium sp. A623]